MFSIKNGFKEGGALSPLLLKFVVKYVIRRDQVNQDGLKLNGTLQLVVYVDGHILGAVFCKQKHRMLLLLLV